ncbi:MAG: preprotein translocase subunit SecE [Gaiellaceae bacterium]
MARQTRSDRRARRQEQARAAADRPRDGRQQLHASAAPAEAAPRAVPGGRIRRFVSESIAELRKVEWPTQHQLITGTTVVLIACIIVGFYLWIADLAFHRLVRDVFLR